MCHFGILTKAAIVIATLCSISVSQTAAVNSTDHLPSIADLEQLSFTQTDATSTVSVPYADVSSVRGLFLAYEAGLGAVSKYRDPVLTRGSSGVNVFKSVAPAVVVVVVGCVKDNDFNPEGMGTGALVDTRGYVLTNWHVIKGHSVAVVFLKPINNSELEVAHSDIARVIYQDPMIDLALLKMGDPPSGLHSVAVGDIDHVQIAEDIHVIGHPHGACQRL